MAYAKAAPLALDRSWLPSDLVWHSQGQGQIHYADTRHGRYYITSMGGDRYVVGYVPRKGRDVDLGEHRTLETSFLIVAKHHLKNKT